MDANRFDTLVKSLASTDTRRESPGPAYDLSHRRVLGSPTAKYDFR